MALLLTLTLVILLTVLSELRYRRSVEKLEADINAAGYFLRDDREIRAGVEHFKGHEEAYSLHTRNPFQRHMVFAMSRRRAVECAHNFVFKLAKAHR